MTEQDSARVEEVVSKPRTCGSDVPEGPCRSYKDEVQRNGYRSVPFNCSRHTCIVKTGQASCAFGEYKQRQKAAPKQSPLFGGK